jgi:excisionase family DNA binding protein
MIYMPIVAHRPDLMTVTEVAMELGVSADTVRRRIRSGELPAVQLGGKGCTLRVDRAELEAWLYQANEDPR